MNRNSSDITTKPIEHFKEVLSLTLNSKNRNIPTFQSIAGYPNYENVLSNIYKFFLESEHHGLDGLFINSLDDCLDKENVIINGLVVTREFYTKKGGRIDLVLSDNSSLRDAKKVVIIENKIHHTLENDFEDYWETFSHVDDKIGLVLTLNKVAVPDNYHNVTHQEWIEKIKSRLGAYISNGNSKYIIYLNDFIQYIEELYKKTFDMESLIFLFEQGQKVEELLKLRNDGINFLRNRIKEKIEESRDWEYLNSIKSGCSFTRIRAKTKGNIIVYFYFNKIFESKSIIIEAWIKGEVSTSRWVETGFGEEIERNANDNQIILNKKPPAKEWGLLGNKEYELRNSEDLYKLAEIAMNHLENDWAKFVSLIEERLED